MSRIHTRSSKSSTPVDPVPVPVPDPSSSPPPMMTGSADAGPSKRKRSLSGDVKPTSARRARDGESKSPRRRVKVEEPAGSSGEWTYQFEIVQQPQRARACGFGDKDRRPLSPPPILRLWVRDSAGNLVDPNLISVQFLVMMVDLWSAEGDRPKNVVMHPTSQGSSRADSPTRHASEQTSRPGTGQSTGWPAPPFRMGPGSGYPSVMSPLLSPHTTANTRPLPSTSGWHSGAPPPAPPRPSTMRGRSFTRPMTSLVEPIRPTTAPTSRHPLEESHPARRRQGQGQGPDIGPGPTTPNRPEYTLPPISSITLRDPAEPSSSSSSRVTLPALHERPPTRDTHSSGSQVISHDYYPFGRPASSSSTGPWFSSSTVNSESRYKDSVSSIASEVLTPMRESGPPFDRPLTQGTDRPMTGYGSDRPPSSSYDRPPFGGHHPDKYPPYHWERPSTSGGGGVGSHVTFDPHSRDREHERDGDRDQQRSLYLSPRQTHQHRLSNASSVIAPPNYSRVLVGSLCAVCQRLQDQDGQTGLFFFAHDLGVRTEGTFSLKFTLTDLTSLMRRAVVPSEKVKVLAEAYSAPFTVFSAKRFPGVIPTTEFTRHFAKQGVRLPTRQKRTTAGESDNEGEAEGGDDD